MPLFTYQCKNCEFIMEKFQHNRKIIPELVCENCKSTNFEKVISLPRNRTEFDARTNLNEKILPDAKRIQNEIKSGKDSTFLDLYGEK